MCPRPAARASGPNGGPRAYCSRSEYTIDYFMFNPVMKEIGGDTESEGTSRVTFKRTDSHVKADDARDAFDVNP